MSTLDFSSDGKWLASGDRAPRLSTVRLWDVATVKQVAVVPKNGWCGGVEFSLDNEKLLMVDFDVSILNLKTSHVTVLPGPQATEKCATWSAGGRQVAVHIGTHLQSGMPTLGRWCDRKKRHFPRPSLGRPIALESL